MPAGTATARVARGRYARLRQATGLWLAIGALALPALAYTTPRSPATATPATDLETVVDADYGHLPLFFIHNEGQLQDRILYYARGQGHATLFTAEGLVFNLARGGVDDRHGADRPVPQTRTIPMSFRGSNPQVEVSATLPAPTRVNLFYGNDPSQWRSDIGTYSEIVYRNLYDGIDARFYGRDGALVYDMIIAPGADPSRIQIRYQRVQAIGIAADGGLEIDLGDGGVLRQTPPVSYQEIDGERVEVPSSFRLIEDAGDTLVYGFSVAAYDPNRALIIDPSIVYSSYLGGGLVDIGHDITADDEEQAFVVGETTSTDLLPVGGFAGGTDMFMVQLDRKGNTLLSATYIGGSGIDRAYSVVRNLTTGTLIISGETQSTNFPVVNGFQATLGGSSDVFVLDYDPVGNTLLYSTYMGGSGIDQGWDVADGGSGIIYIAGETRSTDFPVTAATALQPTYGGSVSDGFFAKVDTSLVGAASRVYASFIGGNGDDRVNSIDVDGAGNVLLGGRTRQQFPTTPNAYRTTFGGQPTDGFVTKVDLNQAGSAGLLYSSFFGGNSSDRVLEIRSDGGNIVYIAGETGSLSGFPLTASAYDSTLGGAMDAFVAKLDLSLGTAGLLYSSYLGGDGSDTATGVDADAAGNLYVTGITGTPSATAFPTTANAFQTTFGGGTSDGFFTMIDTNQSGAASLLYSTLIGGNGVDEAKGMFLTQTYGQAYITGSTTSSLGFPLGTGPYAPYQGVLQGGTDAFMMRLTFLDNTPSGTGVTVPLVGGEITFNGSVSGGSTWLVNSDSGPQEPAGFKFGSPPVYYYLETTVTYNGTIDVCFDYDETLFSTENALKLQYWTGSGWTNITGSVDTVNNRICGTASFSTEPFAVSEPDPNAIPVMSYSAEAGYGSDGVAPNTGLTTDTYTYKVVYANAADLAPNAIDVCIDGFCYAMGVDTGASATLHDGIYSNGEQYVYSTPLTAGSHNYYFVGVNDAASTPLPAAGNLSGPVVTQALEVTTTSLPPGINATPYNQTLTGTGGQTPYTWSISGGGLPTGLSLDTNTGVISGTPTVPGVYNFTVQLTDNLAQTTTQPLSIEVVDTLSVSSLTLAGATVGTAYSETLTTSGGVAPYTWSIIAGGLPTGLSLDANTGVISGTPTVAGTYNFTVQVDDGSGQTASQALSIQVTDPLVIGTATLPIAVNGTTYNQTLAASGGTTPYTWSISSGSLPTGLSLDTNTGVISGTPTVPGTYNFSVQLTDAGLQTTSQALSIEVADTLGITTITLADATSSNAYNQTLTSSGGAAPYTWSIISGGLPTGLSLDTNTGVISGTPTVPGTYNFTVQLDDGSGQTTSQPLSLTVAGGLACGGSSVATPTGSNVAVAPIGTVAVTYQSVDTAGDTCVEILGSSATFPVGYYFGQPVRVFEITTSALFSGTANVCITYDEARFRSEQTLRLFHWNGGSWDDVTTTVDTVTNLACGVTTSFSPFAVGGELSTAISLTNFSARLAGNRAVIQWTTSSETDHWGFLVRRGERPDGPYTTVNAEPIPAQGGPGLSMSYTYLDTTVEPGKTYYYRLDDINTAGQITAHQQIALRSNDRKAVASTGTGSATGGSVKSDTGGAVDRRGPGYADVYLGLPQPLSAPAAEADTPSTEGGIARMQPIQAQATTPVPRQSDAGTEQAPLRDWMTPVGGITEVAPTLVRDVAEADSIDAFSISIVDGQGNEIEVRRGDGPDSAEVDDLALDVAVVNDHHVVRWQVSGTASRGFALYRSTGGAGEETLILKFIPNFFRETPDVYRYQFTDQTGQADADYQYHLRVIPWGVTAGLDPHRH